MEKAESFSFKVKPEEQGLRLDQYLSKNLNCPISRSRIQRLINAGQVLLSPATSKKAALRANYRVKQRDVLIVNIPPAIQAQVSAEELPLDIVFEDDDVLVVNKPQAMVTHPAVGNYAHTLVNALLNYGCLLSTVNGPLRPGIVHRLDKDTSGLLVVAKNNFAHQYLAQQFRQHSVKRTYIAIVQGRPAHNEGVINLPIARHPQNRQKMTVSFVKSREAVTKYKVLKRYTNAAVLELMPHTGRTHQLRVHLKFFGHPILGDTRYGEAGEFKRLALHAVGLGFRHPRSEKFIEFKVGFPPGWQDILNSLK